MATLQAALKRGIEQTFQIEESELVAEPLPNANHRLALLFYEAAEGGAGVLARLATESRMLAEVAQNALRLMHFNLPDTPPAQAWDAETLLTQEQQHSPQQHVSVCEAGCYQCLLSYYNQTEHNKINRRNRESLELLVALANGKVQSTSAVGASTPPQESSLSPLSAWLQEIHDRKLRPPDACAVSIQDGQHTADALYKATRTLIFLTPPPALVLTYAEERGYRVVVFSANPETWPALFAQHSDIFAGVST
jgi:hypothetical protein